MREVRVGGVLGATLALGLALGACTGGGSRPPGAGAAASSPTDGASAPRAIPQPSVASLNRATRARLAPDGRRVDLEFPRFTHPTKVTNPLFPIADLDAVILGEVEGEPLKIETTLLPETKVVSWRGQEVEALQSQFCAFLDGRITEVAVDLYAQADDGSVWYLGEDVVDYVDGAADTTEGTWRVGLDGPPAMIMPAHPEVGDVYRTENIPGVAFEQVTVRRVGVTVHGPTGRVSGAMVGQELHQDEHALEDKVFAPGYGEFFSGGGHDFEANALSVPADASPGPEPAALRAVGRGARTVLSRSRYDDWRAAAVGLRRVTRAWQSYRADLVPTRLATRMRGELATLGAAVTARRSDAAARAALAVADTGLDLGLRYRSPASVNRARFVLWTRRLALDAARHDPHALHGDVTTLAWIRDRLTPADAAGRELDDQLRHLRSVAEAREFGPARTQAARLRATLRRGQGAGQGVAEIR